MAIYITYASATGNAEVIAKRIYEEALNKSYITPDSNPNPVWLGTLNDLKKQIPSITSDTTTTNSPSSPPQLIICICSTTGNGDVPENGDLFYRFIKRQKDTSMFRHVRCAILGLGDTNYDKFNYAAKLVERRLLELGAQKLCETGGADDATGLEQVVEPWIVSLWNHVQQFCEEQQLQQSGTGGTGGTGGGNDDEKKSGSGDTTTTTTTTTSASSSSSLTDTKTTTQSSLSSTLSTTAAAAVTSGNDASVPTRYLAVDVIPTLSSSSSSETAVTTTTVASAQLTHAQTSSHESLFYANVTGAKYLTSSSAAKQVLHLEFDLSNSGIQFLPGDAIGVQCQNDEQDVNELLQRLGVDATIASHHRIRCTSEQYRVLVPSHLSSLVDDETNKKKGSSDGDGDHDVTVVVVNMRDLFMHRLDIMSPVSPTMLRVLAQYCTDVSDRNQLMMLSTPIALQGAYRVQIQQQRATLSDVLRWYPSCKPDLAHLLQVIPALQPRYYSVSNSQLKNNNEIHIAFTLVEYVTPPPHRITRYGVCTRWLKFVASKFLRGDDVTVPLYLKTTPEFRLPRDLHTPIVMVGPGTGVAPFRGFLQHREALMINETNMKKQDKSTNWLFYGCRTRDKDFLYKTELRNFELHSPLQLNLFVATSQESNSSRGIWYGGSYVQDFLRECSPTLVDILLNRGGYLYVCGDAAGMAKDVHKVMRSLFEEEANLSREEAEQCLAKLESEGRYQKDIWA